MSTPIYQIVDTCENRYLTQQEESEILDYVNDLPQRFKAARELHKAESPASKKMVRRLRDKYPTLSDHHDDQWTKTYRDCQLILRVAAQAMILDDIRYLDEKVLFWMRTIMQSLDLTPELMSDTWTFLKEEVTGLMSPFAAEVFEPYLDRIIEVLSSIPEPAVARV